jgi:NMT1-like family
MKLALLFSKRWLWLYLPVLCGCALALWLATVVWFPLPPKSFTFATGMPNGNYASAALRYRDLLEQRGIRVDIVTTNGSAVPLQRLLDSNNQVQAGFAQGLLAKPNMQGIVALASVERQPIWVFTRIAGVSKISQLKGLRVATSAVNSPGWEISKLLLQHAQLSASDVTLEPKVSSIVAATELSEGRADAMVIVASGDSDIVRQLTRQSDIHMLGIDRVTALVARDTRLKPFVLPQGAIELRGDVPSSDITMVAGHLHLLVRESMHPALQRAILDVAREVHESPSFLQRQGEFPNSREVDYKPSPIATALANGDRPWTENLLPYWWAQLAELLMYAVIPILFITLLVLLWIPSFFNWKVNAALQNFYGELKFLETDIEPTASSRPIEIKNLLKRLDDIEAKVTMLDLPNSYANRWYTLREHIAHAREKLLTMRAR